MRQQWYKFRKKSAFFVLVLLACVVYGISSYISSCVSFWNPRHVNYFLESTELDAAGLIVNTTGCQILDLRIWDESLSSYFVPNSPPEDCRRNYKHWTHVHGKSIILNVTALHEDGFAVDSVRCCYQPITRVEQNIENYDELADATVKVSDECIPLIQMKTDVRAEFVRVRCSSKYWPYFQDIIYRNHHAIAQSNRSQQTMTKVQYWETTDSNITTTRSSRPPNVLILGIDSMSRRNFDRTMKRTKQFLREIGAVEMLGYTKVGENTFPNMVALLSGYSEEELKKICYFSPSIAQDSCPYLWKRFNRAKYLTGHLEDSPGLAIFSRYKTGFVEQQVDFYLRPLMLDAFGMIHAKDCMGPDTQDEKVFQYIESIANMSSATGAPYFVLTWLTNLAHRDMNGGHYGDKAYEKFLRSLDLSNTVLFFMSDHGFRYGAFRETLTGWYEDKLPNQWVYLPHSLRMRFPTWFQSLRTNSRRLLSPFDLYATLNHILDEFTDTVGEPDAYDRSNGTTNLPLLRRQFGQSIFKTVPPDRTCVDAGINQHFCACAVPKKVSFSSPLLKMAAIAAVRYINRLLPSQCRTLSLKQVTGGALLSASNATADHSDGGGGKQERSYAVTFTTRPGDFLFEATVVQDVVQNNFTVTSDVLRMNKMNTDLSCIHDMLVERFCYCG